MEPGQNTRLLDMLPGIYRRHPNSLADLLSAFEAVVFRPHPRSLERQIDDLHLLFDSERTPFVAWLGQWVALSSQEGIPEQRYRQLIAKIIPLYRKRGTQEYVAQMIRLYTGADATVEEEDRPGLKMGFRSRVGVDTRLGEDAFRFRVNVKFLPIPENREERVRQVSLVHRVIHLAKPAYTHYTLTHNMAEKARGLVLAIRSTVGVDTLLWSPEQKKRLRTKGREKSSTTKSTLRGRMR